MLISDIRTIGNRLFKVRKKRGLTQSEVAEKADISDRTYADIERGVVTMRIDSLIKICVALNITPNDVFVAERQSEIQEQDIIELLNKCSTNEKETALKLLTVYIDSI